ncbi:hypothetical protein CEUSTIGMA_g5072.t1 [Chlamydomonas eustigma]|uniref:Uncharacterized protein n=1 Tax=Chlamydomonas eustigma TaxID=1157962 RepID=A0A250X3Y3_9CHLO|nr:hypothetical protein CEUSTIGMA_g5072.t1 [Chlamydomonas eustigma]|eukprot:GAX77629.1 hypothetical protein CEUSTIGMA_g5072.t1 [Chlamydomonas eustigma]
MSKKKSILDELVEEDSSENDSDANDDVQKHDEEDVLAKKPKSLTLEDLQRAGFKGGPSVLLMRPPEEQQDMALNWSDGRAAKAKESENESWQERQQTHYAATQGAEETSALALKAVQHAERLREERRLEKQQQERDRKLSFSQKEKRKREEGKTSRAGSYVEEEKRLGRKFGVFSGFD